MDHGIDERIIWLQNVVDVMPDSFHAPLPEEKWQDALGTFVVYNQRRRVTSSAKRKHKPGDLRVAQARLRAPEKHRETPENVDL